MPFIKEEYQKTRNFIFKKDTRTLTSTAIIAVVLIILIIGVIISGFYLEWF